MHLKKNEQFQMEEWQLDFEWLRVRHYVKDSLNKDELPSFNTILLLIGVQELGRFQDDFTKEEKQDLMHIAVCRLLSDEGYYEFVGRDEDGWPHYKQLRAYTKTGVKNQEIELKIKMIAYFDQHQREMKAASEEE